MLKRYTSGMLALVLLLGILAGIPMRANAAVTMKASAALVDVLKAEEGFREKPYWDYSQWTVGYGTKCPDNKLEEYKKNGISREAAQALLEKELVKTETALNKYAATYNLHFKQNQFDALVSFSYNCGTGWINETSGFFNTAVRQGDMSNAFLYGLCLWSSAGGEYILIDRRMTEANMYINGLYRPSNAGGTKLYPDNFRWVFLDGNGGEVQYKLHAFDANAPVAINAEISSAPKGVDKNGKTFTYTLAGWYTADGKQVKKLDSSLERGQVLYAKWKDPSGKMVSLPKGQTPKVNQVVVTGDSVNVRSGPGTHYPKIDTAQKDMVLELTEVYETSSYTWGKTPIGWLSLSYTSYGDAPVIIRQPDGATAPTGSRAYTFVEAVGTGLTYQWYVAAPGENYFHKSSITGSTYSTTMSAEKSGRQVYCLITDAKGNSVKTQTVSLYQGEALAITQQPENVVATGGTKATATVKASGEGVKYQWYYCDSGSHMFKKHSAAGADYSVEMNGVSHGRMAYCEVTDKYGSKVRSETITLSSSTAVITMQPESVTAMYGEMATVSVSAAGEGLQYRWYTCEAGTSFYAQSSITKATYSVEMNATRAGRKLYCVVTDTAGNTAKSDVVTLKWDKTLAITQQPATVMTVQGNTANVQVLANGEGLRYQWYYCNAGSKEFVLSSTKTNTYSVEMNAGRDGRKIYCQVTDASGKTIKSNTVSINIDKNLQVTEQPVGVTVREGQTAKVKVGACGVGLTYQWYICSQGSKTFTLSSTKSATYSVEMNASRDGRKLYCVITDANGNSVKTDTVTITMAKLNITQQPQNVTAASGTKAKVTVKATGAGLTYQWYVAMPGENYFHKSSVTGSTYSTTMDAAKNGRRVYCVVTDVYGNSVKTNVATIRCKAVQITQQPQNVSVPAGEKVSISVKAEGAGLTYQWYVAMPGINYFHKSSITGSTYSTTMDAAKDGRRVYCVITDATGKKIQSNTATMKMVKLAITQQPQNVTVSNGGKVNISVKAEGAGLTYQWYVAMPGVNYFHKSSIIGSTYSTTMDAAKNGRRVYCVITDATGKKVQTNTVTMKIGEMRITQQPQNVTVPNGGKVNIPVKAEGAGLTYQWYVAMPGESYFHKSSVTGSTYSTTMEAAKNGRRVYCIITDATGKKLQTNTVTIKMK